MRMLSSYTPIFGVFRSHMAIEVSEEALKSVLEGLNKDREAYSQLTQPYEIKELAPRLFAEVRERRMAVILAKESVLVTLFGYAVLTNP